MCLLIASSGNMKVLCLNCNCVKTVSVSAKEMLNDKTTKLHENMTTGFMPLFIDLRVEKYQLLRMLVDVQLCFHVYKETGSFLKVSVSAALSCET